MLEYNVTNAKMIGKQIADFSIYSGTPHETFINFLNLIPEMENDFKVEIIYYALIEFNNEINR